MPTLEQPNSLLSTGIPIRIGTLGLRVKLVFDENISVSLSHGQPSGVHGDQKS